jgi:hypothetical protein
MSTSGLTRTLSAPRQHRERLRARHVREALLSIVALAVVFGVGLMLIRHNPFQSSPTATRSSDSEMATAAIRLAPDHNERCKRLLFDNRTGAFKDAGTAYCGATALPPELAPEGGGPSSGHIDRIRESFRGGR